MINSTLRRAAFLPAASFAAIGLLASGAAAEQETMSHDAPVKTQESISAAEAAIRDWPVFSRDIARAMIEKYGQPTTIENDKITWVDNGPWKKTVVYRNPSAPISAGQGVDVIEQSIAYSVPDEKIPELQRFDRRLSYDKTAGQLSCRSGSENLNYLALNLADEIVNDRRSVEEAHDFYRRTLRMSESGKSSAYMDGFLFPLK